MPGRNPRIRSRPSLLEFYAHPQSHLAGYADILRANAYGGYGKLYESGRTPGPIVEAARWAHPHDPVQAYAAKLEQFVRRHPSRGNNPPQLECRQQPW